jgi:ATP-dependent exoDNAse (exonuclease V) beta subunit
MSLFDSEQRAEATNPSSSFIVQAPAGSGKTEILTQRYLRLLSTVKTPEQIVALTFTRKAANEMRERIILSLQHAAADLKASSPHQQITLNLAKAALKCSEHHHWELLESPNRLRISTIDSLCQSINHAIPLLDKQIAYAQITEQPESDYNTAARQCIQFAIETTPFQPAIKTLLIHVDNNQTRLIKLFTTLLAQRDQWLLPLFEARDQKKSYFEKALKTIEQHELTQFKQSLPESLAAELTRMAREIADTENNPDSPRFILAGWNDFKLSNQTIAKALCHLVLDSDKAIRKSFDHHVGLNKKNCTPEVYKRLKSSSIELLNQLKNYPDFLDALVQVSNLPKPEYDQEQWEVLQALFALLPLLVGHLQVLFSKQNKVDFTTISQQALMALGQAENPTDLALYLDNAIHHLLVDEFQDTSITQYDLLSKLVHGWHEGDGKTLFIVGDPMQSIYRFRQAEVGLFFRAKEQGIGPVRLKSLELSCNFRSTKAIVTWVNHHFATIFPKKFDIESGAVSFHPSVNLHDDDESSKIYAYACKNREHEAERLVFFIKQELHTQPNQTIAVLVRSRSQLASLIPLLKQHQIPYQGTDIDLLAHLVHIRDVWSITQALLYPGNRLSWLSVLHSPYCGLSLTDIHHIAQHNPTKSIYRALLDLDRINDLSDEGRVRASFFIGVMQQALAQRCQANLSDWIRVTLNHLHIDYILESSELDDLEQFWILIDRFEQDGRIPDMNEFLTELNKLYSRHSTPAPLQIMTIHKSKGLEFDTVFLPGLGSKLNTSDDPMFRWLKLPTQDQNSLFLMSPIQAAHQENCPLYDYLSRIDSEKAIYETQRILYVAVTRAKSRLYLFDSSKKNLKSSFRSLLHDQIFVEEQGDELDESKEHRLPELKKLPLDFYLNPKNTFHFIRNQPIKGIATGISRLIGIVTHRLLHWICDNHPSSLDQIPWELAQYELSKLGLNSHILSEALVSIQNQITQLFHDTIGLWIIAKHAKECNEYELLVEQSNNLVTRIIDRVFEDGEKFWVIDFKTGTDEEQVIIDHQKQLNEYSFYLLERTSLPIYCGIYYLSNNRWISWQYELTNGSQPQLTLEEA